MGRCEYAVALICDGFDRIDCGKCDHPPCCLSCPGLHLWRFDFSSDSYGTTVNTTVVHTLLSVRSQFMLLLRQKVVVLWHLQRSESQDCRGGLMRSQPFALPQQADLQRHRRVSLWSTRGQGVHQDSESLASRLFFLGRKRAWTIAVRLPTLRPSSLKGGDMYEWIR
jgi:hypothetical protein